MIANSGHDEHGKYSGGTAGDQTGTEWAVIPWYSRPWTCILRHPDKTVRELIAQLGEEAAHNDLIGYDQAERWSFWKQLQAAGYRPAKITTPCEADCSAGVISIVWAAGELLGVSNLKHLSATYTGNMRAGFRTAGFQVLTASKYLTSDKYLKRGDILLNEAHHVAVYVGGGTVKKTSSGKVADRFDRDMAGTYTVTASSLNLRNTAGDGSIITVMPHGSKVQNYGYYTVVGGIKWLYVVYSGKTGFCSSQYLHR